MLIMLTMVVLHALQDEEERQKKSMVEQRRQRRLARAKEEEEKAVRTPGEYAQYVAEMNEQQQPFQVNQALHIASHNMLGEADGDISRQQGELLRGCHHGHQLPAAMLSGKHYMIYPCNNCVFFRCYTTTNALNNVAMEGGRRWCRSTLPRNICLFT